MLLLLLLLSIDKLIVQLSSSRLRLFLLLLRLLLRRRRRWLWLSRFCGVTSLLACGRLFRIRNQSPRITSRSYSTLGLVCHCILHYDCDLDFVATASLAGASWSKAWHAVRAMLRRG